MSRKRKPAYLLHKATGQSRVRIDGKDHYLGAYGEAESKARYEELMTEWLLSHSDRPKSQLTVDELALLYLEHARSYYVKNGKQTAKSTMFGWPCARWSGCSGKPVSLTSVPRS